MDLKSRVVEMLENRGGRILCNELIKTLKDDIENQEAFKREFKKALSAVAYVEHSEDKKRYLVLKERVRNNEIKSSTKSVSSQATQTPNKTPHNSSSKENVSGKPMHPDLSVPKRPSYSTYTSHEPRQWWLASLDCRHADMARLLGLNPKLVDWHNPIDGWTALHYAAKYGNAKCLKLLATQNHVNVNTRNRCGQTPLHVACMYSQRVAIRMLVDEFKANTCILDFSGHYPVSLLSKELQSEFEVLLTVGHVQQFRSALQVLQTGNSHTDSQGTKDTCGSHVQTEYGGEFKRPPISGRPLRQRATIPRQTSNIIASAHSTTLPSGYKPTLAKSPSIVGEGVLSRRTSVLINMLHTATQFAAEHERANALSDPPSCPSSPTTQVIDKKPTACGDAISTGSSSTSASTPTPTATLQPPYCPLRYSLDQHEPTAIPRHKLPKRMPSSANPKALAALLSLLPSSPSRPTEQSSKSRSHQYRQASKSIGSQSSSSLTIPTCSSPKRPQDYIGKKLMHSAAIAETDMRRLAARVTSAVKRKASTKSLNGGPPTSPQPHVSRKQPNESRVPVRSYSASHSVDCTPVY